MSTLTSGDLKNHCIIMQLGAVPTVYFADGRSPKKWANVGEIDHVGSELVLRKYSPDGRVEGRVISRYNFVDIDKVLT